MYEGIASVGAALKLCSFCCYNFNEVFASPNYVCT